MVMSCFKANLNTHTFHPALQESEALGLDFAREKVGETPFFAHPTSTTVCPILTYGQKNYRLPLGPYSPVLTYLPQTRVLALVSQPDKGSIVEAIHIPIARWSVTDAIPKTFHLKDMLIYVRMYSGCYSGVVDCSTAEKVRHHGRTDRWVSLLFGCLA